MIFLLAYLYAHYVIFLSMVMHMHIKLANSFGKWLFLCCCAVKCQQTFLTGARCVAEWMSRNKKILVECIESVQKALKSSDGGAAEWTLDKLMPVDLANTSINRRSSCLCALQTLIQSFVRAHNDAIFQLANRSGQSCQPEKLVETRDFDFSAEAATKNI